MREDTDIRKYWDEWIHVVPFIKFPSHWEVAIIPPFGGAVARFRVKKGNDCISVYLDCNEYLGSWGGDPYWEIFPYEEDVYRVDMNNTDDLIKYINLALSEVDKNTIEDLKNKCYLGVKNDD